MLTREQLLISIADTIHDYRAGDIDQPTPEHVECWVKQFDKDVQLPILQEMDHVLKQTYFSRIRVTEFLQGLIHTKALVGDDPRRFWRNVKFLEIQEEGESQTELLALFNKLLEAQCGFGIDQCGDNTSTFLYLDDGIFTGNRTRGDIRAWVRSQAPSKAKLHIATIAIHLNGYFHARKHIKEAAKVAEKKINIQGWCEIELENRIMVSCKDRTDVLRLTKIPDETNVKEYIEQAEYRPKLRSPGNIGGNALYTGDEGKKLLEREFLKKGVRILKKNPKLGPRQRPLGHTPLDTFGFGSLIVTYRNCPNNVPLALWVGKPWYPLFPRVTHNHGEIKRRIAHQKRESKTKT